jgi:hypothetical protein
MGCKKALDHLCKCPALTCLTARKLGKKKQRFRLWRQKFLAGLNTVGLDSEEVGGHFAFLVFQIRFVENSPQTFPA